MGCFINFTNHRSEKWNNEQTLAAERYGTIIDVEFPMIDASSSEEEISSLAKEYKDIIVSYNPAAVLVQGEFSFVFSIVSRLLDEDIIVLTACSDRVAEEVVKDDGTVEKKSEFRFVRFRRYKRN